MKKQTLRIAASAATVGVMSIVGFGMVAHAEPNPIKAVGQSFNGMFHRHGGHGPMQNLASVATALNMSEADVRTQLDSGKSLADIAAAQNVSVQSVIDAVVADMKAHVSTEVASGEITQTEADAKLADVVARATDMVNGVRPAGIPEGMAGGMGGRGPSPESITAIAKVLNLTEAQLQTEVQSGKSLADIAGAQKVNVQSVIDAVVTQMKSHIAGEVASGEITQTEADAKLADVVARATEMVNGVRPAGMPEGMAGGMGGRGPSPESITAIAKVLNLTEAQLQTEVQSGKSLADIAGAQKVNVQSVIDAVVTQMKAHIASEVASGEITQAQADAKLADVIAHATDMVNGVRPAGMPGDKVGGMGGGKGGFGHHGHDDGGAEDGDA